ncbi:MAG: vitamin K epoxide reductase family protein [Verrucomicrobiales bacterium]
MAAIFSAYLVWKWTKGESDGLVLSCAGDDCSKVLDSHWSRVFSIPVSLLGLTLYVPMVASSFFIASRFARNVRSAAWSALTAGATMALLGAAYFIYLMKARIGATCPTASPFTSPARSSARWCSGAAFADPAEGGGDDPGGDRGDGGRRIGHGAVGLGAKADPQCGRDRSGDGQRRRRGAEPGESPPCGATRCGHPRSRSRPRKRVRPWTSRRSAHRRIRPARLTRSAKIRSCAKSPPKILSRKNSPPPIRPIRGSVPPAPKTSAGPPKPKPGGSFALPGQEDYPNSAPDPQPAPAPGPAPFRPTGEKPDPAPAAVAGNASTRVAPAERIVNFFDGSLALPVHDLPIIGRPDAEHIMVELFDYTCDHCREFYPALLMAKLRYGDQIAIVLLPTPLNSKCNQYLPEGQFDRPDACEYARYALAVFRADRDKFPLFHDWLIKVEPLPSEARDYAAELVGKPAFDRALADGWVGETLKRGTALYGDLAKTNRKLPKLVLGGSKVMQGLPQDVRTLFAVIESSVPVTPVQAQTQP